MKQLFIALALFCGISQAGIIKSFRVDTSSTNLATTFSTAAQSLVASSQKGICKVCACNPSSTSATIAMNVDDNSATVAPTANVSDIYIQAGLCGCVYTDKRTKVNVYLRSDSGSTITSGILTGDLRDKCEQFQQ